MFCELEVALRCYYVTELYQLELTSSLILTQLFYFEIDFSNCPALRALRRVALTRALFFARAWSFHFHFASVSTWWGELDGRNIIMKAIFQFKINTSLVMFWVQVAVTSWTLGRKTLKILLLATLRVNLELHSSRMFKISGPTQPCITSSSQIIVT